MTTRLAATATPGIPRRFTRMPLLAAVPLLHLACYWIVTRVTAARGSAVLWHTAIPLDARIPHLAWTWPFYWVAYPFIIIGGGVALTKCDHGAVRRAIVALMAMTVIGAVIQLVVPARAPWPATPGAMQQHFHDSALVMPFATLPSMHVAYATVVAGLLAAAYPSRVIRTGGVVVVLLIAISTLTLKEHVILDAITGVVLALATLRWWRGAES